MATGRRAFDGKSKTSLIAAILSQQPPPISQVVPVTPPALDHVVRKCLEKDPDDRWQSAHDVASELHWIGEAGSQAGVPARMSLRRRSRERLAWSLAAVLGVTAAALGAWQLLAASGPAAVLRATLDPPPGQSLIPFDELGLTLSPDGRRLAFVAYAADGSKQIWVRDLASMAARPVPETSGAWYPFWSPDGQSLGYFASGKLKRVDLRGGAPETIADAPSGRGGSWGRGDVILYSPLLRGPIHSVPAGGGTPAAVSRYNPEQEITHRWPHFLPDGRHFLYMSRARVSGKAEVGRLMLASLDSPEPRLLIDDATNATYVEPGYLLYGRAGELYAWRFDAKRLRLSGRPLALAEEKLSTWEPKNLTLFAASDSGTIVYLPAAVPKTVLQWYDPGGRPLEPLGPPGFYLTPRVSPDGKKVAYALGESSQGLNDLWILDLEYERPFRLTQSSGRYSEPAWSRDSTRIAYGCQPSSAQDICVRSLVAGTEVQVLGGSASWKTSPSFLPDGRSLVFAEQDPNTDYDLVVSGAGKDAERHPVLKTPFAELGPEVSPDGRFIAYLSRETGRSEVVVRAASGAYEQWPVSNGGGSQPRWRADGRELYYATPEGDLMAVAIATEPVFRPGAPRKLFRLPERPDRDTPVFEDVTPDGKRFLLNVPAGSRSSVGFHVILNWPALRQRPGD